MISVEDVKACIPIEYRDRLFSKIQITETCWEWMAGLSYAGYGQFNIKYSNTRSHRLIYQLVFGEIDPTLQIDHLCKNRKCQNPNHMEAVTAHENTMRSNAPSAINSKKTQCVLGHELTGKNLLVSALKLGHRSCRECSRIRKRSKYRHDIEKTGRSVEPWRTAKTHCKRGHILSGDNLVPGALKRGQRNCRICIQNRGIQKRIEIANKVGKPFRRKLRNGIISHLQSELCDKCGTKLQTDSNCTFCPSCGKSKCSL